METLLQICFLFEKLGMAKLLALKYKDANLCNKAHIIQKIHEGSPTAVRRIKQSRSHYRNHKT